MDTPTDPGLVVRNFINEFASKDAERLGAYLHPDVEFQAYGNPPVRGRADVIALWRGVFAAMENVAFTTVHQAVNGDIVIEEQVHGLALPGRSMAPIMNMAIYRIDDGLIREWRDYTDSQYARTLM